MEFVEPKVFLIAESKIDYGQLKEMLAEVGGDTALQWFAKTKGASKSEGELLTEVSGRICYKSFGIGLNPNVTKIRQNSQDYIDNTLSKGDGSIFEHASCTFAFLNVSRVFCYSADTEVLTSEGWRRFDTIDGSEDFATLNPHRVSPRNQLHSEKLRRRNGSHTLFDCGPPGHSESPDILFRLRQTLQIHAYLEDARGSVTHREKIQVED
jgi:hypothetical protein